MFGIFVVIGFFIGVALGVSAIYEERFRVCHIKPKPYAYRMTFKNGKYHKLACQNLAKDKKTCVISQKSCPIAV